MIELMLEFLDKLMFFFFDFKDLMEDMLFFVKVFINILVYIKIVYYMLIRIYVCLNIINIIVFRFCIWIFCYL